MVGRVLGNYLILKLLGEGGMGAVYLAVFEKIERHVAVKVLHSQLAEHPEFVGRFLNEARTSNRIAHPGIVQITDYGQDSGGSGALYIAMEYLTGELLSHRLHRAEGHRLPVQKAVQLVEMLASALAAAHKSGVVHRDLKPDNIMLVPDPDLPQGERTKIMDFGIAKLLATVPELPNINSVPTHLKTRANTVMGTPAYMAPEQCREARSVDEKADVYALGVLFYEMLSGQLPFSGGSLGDVMAQHIIAEPPDLQRLAPHVPAVISALVHHMLQKDPQQRPTALEVLNTIREHEPQRPHSTEALAQGSSSRGLPARRVGAILGALLMVLAGGGALGWHIGRSRQPATIPSASSAITEVIVTSEPSGAQVVSAQSGQLLGTTPFTRLRVESSLPERIVLKLPRHQDDALEIVPMPGKSVIYKVRLRPSRETIGTYDDYAF